MKELTVCLHTLRHHLKAHHSEVVLILSLQLLSVVVQDEGEVVVQVELWNGWKSEQTKESVT